MIQETVQNISTLFQTFSHEPVIHVEKLPQSGGDRIYFRIETQKGSFIATFSDNIKENNTFIEMTRHFNTIGVPVPEIFCISTDRTIYIQEDFGNSSLLNELENEGYTPRIYALFEKSVAALAHMQIRGYQGFKPEWCITSREFGKQAILSDLLYFKYYFLDTLKVPYDKEKLLDDFEALSNYLHHADHKYFMYRDFQSRNIMIQQDEVHFIDYQGGMKGAVQYDVASLLWQAKAGLSGEWKKNLLQYYMDQVEVCLETTIDRNRFEAQYNGYVLIRLLQVLGAYGFRGLFERKAHFLTSIPLALRNIQWFLSNAHAGIALPEFDRIIARIVEPDIIRRFENIHADASTPLVVTINSFSYKKGIPADHSENGGGFVFDCRGILNPGRFDEYRHQSGLDKPVKDFLEQQTRMPDFLNNVYNIADIAVENYIQRGFESLHINFGCTGGQHRSVFAAEAMARHLRNKFNVKVKLEHTNRENWV